MKKIIKTAFLPNLVRNFTYFIYFIYGSSEFFENKLIIDRRLQGINPASTLDERKILSPQREIAKTVVGKADLLVAAAYFRSARGWVLVELIFTVREGREKR